MITRSTRSLTDRSVPPLPDTAATTALPPVPPTAPVHGPDAGPPSEAGPAYPDPAVRTAELPAPRVEMTESSGIAEATFAPARLAAPAALLALLVSLLGARRTRVAPSTPDRRPPSGG
ncbi:hypothetical protein [Streptomyces sp. NPDC057690]|uniref:hypothetical protein n=1 Tax=Streptomyces sp. NPDC057690 TaxID=3346214 RepID=UPI0036CCD83E